MASVELTRWLGLNNAVRLTPERARQVLADELPAMPSEAPDLTPSQAFAEIRKLTPPDVLEKMAKHLRKVSQGSPAELLAPPTSTPAYSHLSVAIAPEQLTLAADYLDSLGTLDGTAYERRLAAGCREAVKGLDGAA